jgi:hypothetical protein
MAISRGFSSERIQHAFRVQTDVSLAMARMQIGHMEIWAAHAKSFGDRHLRWPRINQNWA